MVSLSDLLVAEPTDISLAKFEFELKTVPKLCPRDFLQPINVDKIRVPDLGSLSDTLLVDPPLHVEDPVTGLLSVPAYQGSPAIFHNLRFPEYFRQVTPHCNPLHFLHYSHSDSVNQGSNPCPPAKRIQGVRSNGLTPYFLI